MTLSFCLTNCFSFEIQQNVRIKSPSSPPLSRFLPLPEFPHCYPLPSSLFLALLQTRPKEGRDTRESSMSDMRGDNSNSEGGVRPKKNKWIEKWFTIALCPPFFYPLIRRRFFIIFGKRGRGQKVIFLCCRLSNEAEAKLLQFFPRRLSSLLSCYDPFSPLFLHLRRNGNK